MQYAVMLFVKDGTRSLRGQRWVDNWHWVTAVIEESEANATALAAVAFPGRARVVEYHSREWENLVESRYLPV